MPRATLSAPPIDAGEACHIFRVEGRSTAGQPKQDADPGLTQAARLTMCRPSVAVRRRAGVTDAETGSGRMERLHYSGGLRRLSDGDHVVCAMTAPRSARERRLERRRRKPTSTPAATSPPNRPPGPIKSLNPRSIRLAETAYEIYSPSNPWCSEGHPLPPRAL